MSVTIGVKCCYFFHETGFLFSLENAFVMIAQEIKITITFECFCFNPQTQFVRIERWSCSPSMYRVVRSPANLKAPMTN